jgi:hypothetical protein
LLHPGGLGRERRREESEEDNEGGTASEAVVAHDGWN